MEVAELQVAKPSIAEPQPQGTALRGKKRRGAHLNLELGNDFLIWSLGGGKNGTVSAGGIIVDSNLSQPDGAPVVINQLVDHLGLTRCSVKLCLSISEAILRTFYVAVVPKSELQQVVLWEAERVFPFAPHPDLFAWRILDSVQWSGARKFQIQAVAVPPQRMRPTFEYLRSTHRIEDVVLTATAWESLLCGQSKASVKKNAAAAAEDCVAVVRLLGDRLSVLCLHKGNIEFTREAHIDSINIGNAFEASLGKLSNEALSTDRLHYQSLDISELARTVAEELDFYYGQFSQRNISKIYLAFPPEIEDAARNALGKQLGVQITPVLSQDFGRSAASQSNYLFLPSSPKLNTIAKRLNLTPPEIRQDKREEHRFRISIGVALLAVLAVLAAWWLQREELSSAQQYRDSLRQLTEAQLNSPAYQQLVALRSTGETWQIQWQQFRQSTEDYSHLLKLISNYIPDNTYLSSMQVLTGHPEGAVKFVDASLNGFVSQDARHPELVLVEFIRELRASPLVRKVELRGHQRVISSEGRSLSFTLRVEMM